MSTLTTTLLVALALLQATVSARVLRNGEITSRQKALQILLVWMLPIVGALACLAVERHMHMTPAAKSRNHDPLYNPGDGS
jgi:hypothetical protein